MQHTIMIRVRHGNVAQGMTADSIYHVNPEKRDHMEFRSSLIRITCERSKAFDADAILTNNSNTIFRQIMKLMLFYGALNRQNGKINKLLITRGVKNIIQLAEVEYTDKNQPVAWQNISFVRPFNSADLADNLFAGNYGDKLSTILSHWLVGLSSKDRYKKFESLWRAFEQLCDHHNRAMANRKEFDNLRKMRTLMEGHHEYFPETDAFMGLKDYAWLRAFQWKQLIYNNYPLTATKMGVWEGYRDNFVLRNKDSRIIQLLKDTLVYRADKLHKVGVKPAIDAHIAQYTAQPITDNIQLAAFLCCKLAYFVRNKMFHGEVYERNFRFYNTLSDDIQLDEINSVLEVLTYELIEHFVVL